MTPSTLDSAILTVIGQVAQVMLGTDSVTVLVAAEAGALRATARASSAASFFMTISGQ